MKIVLHGIFLTNRWNRMVFANVFVVFTVLCVVGYTLQLFINIFMLCIKVDKSIS